MLQQVLELKRCKVINVSSWKYNMQTLTIIHVSYMCDISLFSMK